MISETTIKSTSAKLKNGVLKVTISFLCSDQEEYKRLETLKDLETPVNITISEVRQNAQV